MRVQQLVVPFLAVLPFVTACPLDDLDPDKGAGGSGGYSYPNPFADAGVSHTGGVSGAGGSKDAGAVGGGSGGISGSGGAPASGGACAVKCLDDLIAKCTVAMGSCVGEANPATSTSNVCFQNGVRYFTSVQGTTSYARYMNPDGSVCYLQETPAPTTDFTKVTAYWKDGSGKLVVTEMVDVTAKTSSWVCADGTSYQLGPACWGLAGGGTGSMTSGGCSEGTCH
jgi:hypothetical protein